MCGSNLPSRDSSVFSLYEASGKNVASNVWMAAALGLKQITNQGAPWNSTALTSILILITVNTHYSCQKRQDASVSALKAGQGRPWHAPEKTGVSRGPVQCSTPRTAPPMGKGVGRMASVRRRSLASTPGTLALSRYCPVSGFISMSPAQLKNMPSSCEINADHFNNLHPDQLHPCRLPGPHAQLSTAGPTHSSIA
jgi:hypothetical protein